MAVTKKGDNTETDVKVQELVEVTLQGGKKHTHKGASVPAGGKFKVRKDQAKRLEKRGIAK